MSRFSRSQLFIASVALAAPFTLLAACSSDSGGGGNGGSGNFGNTGNPGGFPGGGGVPGGGGFPGGGGVPGGGGFPGGGGAPGGGVGGVVAGSGGISTGGVTAGGAAGAGGATTAPAKLCATKVTLSAPTITDFESYNGTINAYDRDMGQTPSWNFTMGTPMMAYAGLYPLSEGPAEGATYTLRLGAGANASNWAAIATNTATTAWGGGIGFWMGCINASAYSGITFSVRGNTPLATATFFISTEDTSRPGADPLTGGTCDAEPAPCSAYTATLIPITADWTTVNLPWSAFTAGGIGAGGVRVPLTGDKIVGLSLQADIDYSETPPDYPPLPGSYELAIDNLAFMP